MMVKRSRKSDSVHTLTTRELDSNPRRSSQEIAVQTGEPYLLQYLGREALESTWFFKDALIA